MLLALVAILLSAQEPPTIRDHYYTIPLNFLPGPKAQMAADNRGERDRMITRYDKARQFMILEKPGTATDTRMQLFTGEEGQVNVLIETTTCLDYDCDNSMKVISLQDDQWVDLSTEVAPDLDFNTGKMQRTIKKAYKESYGNLEEFEELGYNDESTLKSALLWRIGKNQDIVYLEEPRLPLKLLKLVWNKKKNTFDAEKY